MPVEHHKDFFVDIYYDKDERPSGPPLSTEAVRGNIIYFRTNKGFTKRAMAERMGINEVSYARIESGEIGLSYEHLCKIAIIFEMSVINLIAYPQKYVEEEPYGKYLKHIELESQRRGEEMIEKIRKLIQEQTVANQKSDYLIEKTNQLKMQVEYLERAVKDKEVIIHLMVDQNNLLERRIKDIYNESVWGNKKIPIKSKDAKEVGQQISEEQKKSKRQGSNVETKRAE